MNILLIGFYKDVEKSEPIIRDLMQEFPEITLTQKTGILDSDEYLKDCDNILVKGNIQDHLWLFSNADRIKNKKIFVIDPQIEEQHISSISGLHDHNIIWIVNDHKSLDILDDLDFEVTYEAPPIVKTPPKAKKKKAKKGKVVTTVVTP